jgi:hypothetical protein
MFGPPRGGDTEKVEEEPRVRDVWKACVIAGIRNKVGAVVLVLVLAAAVWQFYAGRIGAGLIILGVGAFTYGRVPALIGAVLGVRSRDRERRRGR